MSHATLPEGGLEDELYTDVIPLRVRADPASPARGRLWEPRFQLQNEIEYGSTDRWEMGFHQVFGAKALDGGENSVYFDLEWPTA